MYIRALPGCCLFLPDEKACHEVLSTRGKTLGGDTRDDVLPQVWQWLRHKARLDNGQVLTKQLFDSLLDEEMQKLRR